LLQRLFHDFVPQHNNDYAFVTNRSNYAFRYGLLRLATKSTAKSGFNQKEAGDALHLDGE
jgi:hypothetical protein